MQLPWKKYIYIVTMVMEEFDEKVKEIIAKMSKDGEFNYNLIMK